MQGFRGWALLEMSSLPSELGAGGTTGKTG